MGNIGSYFSAGPAVPMKHNDKGHHSPHEDEEDANHLVNPFIAEPHYSHCDDDHASSLEMQPFYAGDVYNVEGVLKKQPTSATKQDITDSWWKERYFVLRRGVLFYYVVDSEMEIDLAECQLTRSDDHLPVFGQVYTVTLAQGKTWKVASHSPTSDLRTLRKFYLLQYEGTVWESWSEYHVVKKANDNKGTLILQRRRQKGAFLLRDGSVEKGDGGILYLRACQGSIGVRYLTLCVSSGCEDEVTRWYWALSKMCMHETNEDALSSNQALDFYNLLHDVMARNAHVLPGKVREAKKRYLILSIDGGGTRGIIPCVLLQRIVARFPTFLSQVSLVSGTSNGALIGLGIAFGYKPDALREMTELTSRYVFSEQQARYSLSQAKWSNRFLSIFCKEVWKDKTMADCHVSALVPTLLLDNEDRKHRSMQVKVFHSADKNSDFVSDVVMRSCAAPTFFPSWQGYVDGGICAHSPADLALSQVAAGSFGNVEMENVFLLSISTGHVPHYYTSDTQAPLALHNWGYYQWSTKLTTTLWDTMIEKSSLVCENFLGKRFHRVDPVLDEEMALDQPELLPKMACIAEKVDLSSTFDWIEKFLEE